PAGPRPLTYTLTACPVDTDTLRCDDPTVPTIRFADSMTSDVDAAPPTGVLTVNLELLKAALAADTFHGLGGVPVQVELVIRAARRRGAPGSDTHPLAPARPAPPRRQQHPHDRGAHVELQGVRGRSAARGRGAAAAHVRAGRGGRCPRGLRAADARRRRGQA